MTLPIVERLRESAAKVRDDYPADDELIEEAADTIEELVEVLTKALPFLGSAASRSQIICGVDAGELYFVIEDLLAKLGPTP